MPKEKDTVKSIELAYERSHALSVERYAKRIDDIYNTYTLEYTKMAGSILNIDVSKPFTFSDYPQTNDRINNLLKEQFNAVKTTITKGVDDEWIRSCLKNDKIVKKVLSRKKLTEDHYKRYYQKYNSRNEDSLKAFKLRKDNGLDLSKRVWKHTASFKDEIEAAIDAAISSGQTATGLAAEVKKYLDQPDKLFRRVKGPDGRLRLSKPAQAYKPGQGVYRSSHKNAMRLARTEINMSYRTSDYLRYQQLDFIVGIRISLSNNPRHCPVCQELAGDYPKSFKFVGWHPMCRCFTTTILKTPDELDKDEYLILKGEQPSSGSKSTITAPPASFISWINDNKDRIANAKSVPYWVKDNFKDGLLANGLNVVAPVSTKPIKTDQQKADIQARWNSRVAGRKHGGHLTDLRAKYGKGSDTIAKMEIQIRNQISKGIGLTDIDKMVDMLNHKVQVKIAWDERLLVNANKVSSKLDEVILTLDKLKVDYNDVKKLQKELAESDIIERIGGGDMTKGSCSSLAFAYAGNKSGFDVLDFRDGVSRQVFSRTSTIMDISKKAGGNIVKHVNDFTKANELLKSTQIGKEYYFTCGAHATIVRRTTTGLEYLELQSATSNGFKPLNNIVLKQRFGAKKSRSSYGMKIETPDCIIDIDMLKKDPSFRKVLGYINTNESEQRKGVKGRMR